MGSVITPPPARCIATHGSYLKAFTAARREERRGWRASAGDPSPPSRLPGTPQRQQKGHHGLKAPKEDKPEAVARHWGKTASWPGSDRSTGSKTETRCSHRRDEAKKFALSSFPSSSFREAEPSSLPKKRSSASDVPSEPRGGPAKTCSRKPAGLFSGGCGGNPIRQGSGTVAARALKSTSFTASAEAADLMLPNLEIVFCRRKHTKGKKPKNPKPQSPNRTRGQAVIPKALWPGCYYPALHLQTQHALLCLHKQKMSSTWQIGTFPPRRPPSAPALPYLQG